MKIEVRVKGANNPIVLDGGFELRNHGGPAVRRLRGEHGFTLIEIMVAMALMSVGVAATLGVFGSSGRTALRPPSVTTSPRSRRRRQSTC